MKITNPTGSEIAMQFLGVAYKLAANETKDMAEEVALHWKNRVHEFVILGDNADAPVAAPAVVKEAAPAPEKGTEKDPFTREEAIEAGIDVDAAEASAEPLEEEVVVTKAPTKVKK